MRMRALPLCRSCVIPAGCAVADVRTALVVLTARHEALRTVFPTDEPVQIVCEPAEPDLVMWHVHEDDLTDDALADRARQSFAEDFEPDRHWPWRAVLLVARGVPRRLLLVLHPMAFDGWGASLVAGEAATLLADRTVLPATTGGWHPVDQALFEATATARRGSDQAIAYWRKQLDLIPHNMLAPFRPPSDQRSHFRLSLESRALMTSCQLVADRHRVSPAVSLLAEFASLLAQRGGLDRLVLGVLVANRFQTRARGSVGCFAMPGVVAVDLSGQPDHRQMWARVQDASLHAYRHATYDPGVLRATEIEHALDAGISGSPLPYFNFRSSPDTSDPTPERHDGRPVGTTLSGNYDGMFLNARLRGATVRLSLTVGDALFDRAEAEELLAELPPRIAAAAADPRSPVATRPLADTARVQPGWVRVARCWVNLRDTAALLAACPGVARAAVFPATDGGRHRLTAYVAGHQDLEPAELWRHVLDELAAHPSVMLPSWYVVCRDAPADAHSVAAWQAQPVIRQGTGHRSGGQSDDAATSRVEQVLVMALLATHPGCAVDLAQSYTGIGGEFLRVPALLTELRGQGWVGLSVESLLTPRTLRKLALQLHREEDSRPNQPQLSA